MTALDELQQAIATSQVGRRTVTALATSVARIVISDGRVLTNAHNLVATR
jgi:hypothetical protein